MMKKILVSFLVCASLVACSKDSEGGDTKFKKGQECSITVKGGDATKVTTSYDKTGRTMSFTWETDETIKVTVGGASASFAMTDGGGTASGTFYGKMPKDGDTFSVQYPVATPDLSTQDYVEDALPHNKMLLEDSECSLSEKTFTLEPQYAALLLQFYDAYARKISRIEIKNLSTSKVYTLDCGDGVTLGTSSDAPTLFFTVLPTGTYKFDVSVYSADEDNLLLGKFVTSKVNTFTKGKIHVMAVKEIKNIISGVTEELSEDEQEFYN